ncbi:MAG: hypothetical protein JST86_15355 [Bacteroidetes bacterium]|nr:hypothetical protein [Bacteroidota bacterium]
MKPILLIFSLVLALSFSQGCYYDNAALLYPNSNATCDTSTAATFTLDVMPVMNANCNLSGCHNTASASGGVILDTYNGVKAQVSSGRLMGSINQTGAYSPMPQGANKLNSCIITRIQQWINAGALP